MAASRVFLASPALVMIMSILGGEAFAQCANPPGPDQVTVWQDHNFEGKCKTLDIGAFRNSSSLRPVPNDSISSLKVGSDVRAHLFKDANFKGPVALYEAGSSHNVSEPDSSPFSLGPNVNDETTSIIVQETFGVRVPYIFLGDYPSDRETVWSEEAQGVCHTDTHWFITRNWNKTFSSGEPTLFKIPLSADLNTYDPSVGEPAHIPGFLKRLGYGHMGDPDCITRDGESFVFVPLEDPRVFEDSTFDQGSEAGVAVFRASNLSFVNFDVLYVNDDKHAGWVAIDPSNGVELWASRTELASRRELERTGLQGVFKYAIDWSQVVPGGGFIFFGGAGPAVPLKNRQGDLLRIKGMQGGVFDTTGSVLYLSNSDSDSADGHGIFAFLKNTGDWIGETADDYGQFRYTTSCCFQEEEGLDFFPTNTSITPGISGELHAILLNNEIFGSDRIWMKHYTQSQLAKADLVPISPPDSRLFCKSVNGQLQIVARVENQGSAFAPASITTVDFFSFGSVDVPMVGILGGRFIDLKPIKPPAGCFNRDCVFRITVDSIDSVDESNEGNNSVTGVCIG
jgi:hypothetical protein